MAILGDEWTSSAFQTSIRTRITGSVFTVQVLVPNVWEGAETVFYRIASEDHVACPGTRLWVATDKRGGVNTSWLIKMTSLERQLWVHRFRDKTLKGSTLCSDGPGMGGGRQGSLSVWPGQESGGCSLLSSPSSPVTAGSGIWMLLWQMRAWSLTGLKRFSHISVGSDVMGTELCDSKINVFFPTTVLHYLFLIISNMCVLLCFAEREQWFSDFL